MGSPPGRTRIISPYDIDARYSEKRGTSWERYKVHVTETCDNTPADDGTTDPAKPPNLITNVVTTHAAVADSSMTMNIHTMLADRDLLPGEHLMDAGYPSTANLLALRTEHQRFAVVSEGSFRVVEGRGQACRGVRVDGGEDGCHGVAPAVGVAGRQQVEGGLVPRGRGPGFEILPRRPDALHRHASIDVSYSSALTITYS